MAKPRSKGVINKGDYRPQTDAHGPHSKPIYIAGDYRANFFGESAGEKGKGKGKGKGKAKKIFHYSHRLAPGATKDPWGGSGR